MVKCPECGTENPKERGTCHNCEHPLTVVINATPPVTKSERPLLNMNVLKALGGSFVIGFVYGMITWHRYSVVPGVYFEAALFAGIFWLILSFLVGAVIRWFGITWHRSILYASIGLFVGHFTLQSFS